MEKNNKFIQVFDTVFILILCFATLYSAMLLQGRDTGGMNYVVNITTLVITFGLLLIYLIYIIFQSHKGMEALTKTNRNSEENHDEQIDNHTL